MSDNPEKQEKLPRLLVGMCVCICVGFVAFQLVIANICGRGYQDPHSTSSILSYIGLGLLLLSVLGFIGCLIAVIAILLGRLL